MIYCAINCVGRYLKNVNDILFFSRIRSDILLDVLQHGSVNNPMEGHEEIRKYCYEVPSHTGVEIDTFIWSSFMDENLDFFEIGGSPVSPRLVHLKKHKGRRWLEDKYRRLPKIAVSKRVEIAKKIDVVLNENNKCMRKILIIYDISTLVDYYESGSGYKDTLFGNAVANQALASTLQPLGWEIYFVPYGIPKEDIWIHADQRCLKHFWERILPEEFNVDKPIGVKK